MAEVTVTTGSIAADTNRCIRTIVFVTTLTGYCFFCKNGTSDIVYKKTTDGGQTWGSETTVHTDGSAMRALDVWYDRWTPGDITGNLIYIWWFGTGEDDVKFRTLDVSTDTLGTTTTVFNGASASNTGLGRFVSGAKMRGGNLLCVFDIDDGTETGSYRSTDGGATWGARTNLVEAASDWAMVFPGNESDSNDAWILYHDASANELSLKIHDDSADTNSESAIVTVAEYVIDSQAQYPFSGAVRISDGHLIVAVVTEYDTATADFRVWDINGSGSITEKTAIQADVDDLYYPAVFIDYANKIYVAYVGKRDGTETLGSAAKVYYVSSTDGGATWSSGDTAYSENAASSARHLWCCPSGPRFIVMWQISLSLLVNYTSSVSLIAATLTGTATSGTTEANIVSGGRTIIITIQGDDWVASGGTFDGQRQNIIDGIDSTQSEGTGWDAVVKATQGVSGVARTSPTVATVTLDAFATYNITAQETITVTVPSTALAGGVAVVATPTFTVATSGAATGNPWYFYAQCG